MALYDKRLTDATYLALSTTRSNAPDMPNSRRGYVRGPLRSG